MVRDVSAFEITSADVDAERLAAVEAGFAFAVARLGDEARPPAEQLRWFTLEPRPRARPIILVVENDLLGLCSYEGEIWLRADFTPAYFIGRTAAHEAMHRHQFLGHGERWSAPDHEREASRFAGSFTSPGLEAFAASIAGVEPPPDRHADCGRRRG